MSYMAQRVQHYGTTIFTEMTNLANEYGAVNLGQGFPNFAAPEFVKEAARAAISADINQYPPAIGRSRLRHALAAKYARHYNMELDPASQIVAMHGATECLFATIQSLVDPGDEVIIFEPYFDTYVPCVEFAGGTPVYYTLEAPKWEIEPDKLAALFSDKTKLILINTPHNPTGKLFSRAELQMIADLCQQYDVIAISDEVYEHIVFDEAQHIPIATLPGMADRTVTISSIGKSFSVTGWKVGWAIGSAEICTAIFRSHQWITFAGAAPLEEASAAALEWADETGYYAQLQAMYQRKRDTLLSALNEANLPVITPAGTYFAMVDISELGFANDRDFCTYLTKEIGVTPIPPSFFYTTPNAGTDLARFAFCKTDEALAEAADRLQKLGSSSC